MISDISVISNSEILKLFKKNIFTIICEQKENSCSRCGKPFEQGSKVIKLDSPCICSFCVGCAKAYLNDCTENKIILSEFEKSKNQY